jgi:hypothetical protein
MNTLTCNTVSVAERSVPSSGRGGVKAGRHAIYGCLLAASLLLSAAPVAAIGGATPDANLEQWLLRRLNDPTEHERAHERQGNVYIYDGLTDREVERALDEHFDRIEYMMFMGTRQTEPTGEVRTDAQGRVETESPGCM